MDRFFCALSIKSFKIVPIFDLIVSCLEMYSTKNKNKTEISLKIYVQVYQMQTIHNSKQVASHLKCTKTVEFY